MRLVNPAGVLNLIVYDWLEPPPVPLPGLPPASSATAELLAAVTAAAAGCDGDESAGGMTGDDGGGGGSRGVKSGRTRQLQQQRESSGGGASSEGGGGGGGEMAGSMHRSRSTPDVASIAAAAAAAAATEASTSGSPFRYFEDLPPWYCPRSADDTTLVFESRFESGNLRRALQVTGGKRMKGSAKSMKEHWALQVKGDRLGLIIGESEEGEEIQLQVVCRCLALIS